MNPRLLLVEDDPTSRAFLLAATRALPADVDVAEDMATAIGLATSHTHALWLFDARLPDGSGAALLQALRARGLTTPAIAHTASRERSEHDALREAGFIDTLAKPLPAADWVAALRRALGGVAVTAEEAGSYERFAQLPVWDEAQALAALGNSPSNVSGLRTLFLVLDAIGLVVFTIIGCNIGPESFEMSVSPVWTSVSLVSAPISPERPIA